LNSTIHIDMGKARLKLRSPQRRPLEEDWCMSGAGFCARQQARVKEEPLLLHVVGAAGAAGAAAGAAAGTAGAAAPRAAPRAMVRVAGIWYVGPPPCRVRYRAVWSDGRRSWVAKEDFKPHQTQLYESAAATFLLTPPAV
jgi:hypothetical protein